MSFLSENSKVKNLLSVVILLVVLVTIGWLGRDIQKQREPKVASLGTQQCDFSKASVCQFHSKELNVSLSLTTAGDFQSGKPIDAKAVINGTAASDVSLSFQGRDMYMGENHYSLKPQQAGQFATNLQLPVCSTGRMTWQAQLAFNNGKKNQAVTFEFNSQ